MRNVKISETGSNLEYDLSSVQIEQFARELSRTAPWRTLSGLVSFILGRDRYVMPLIAPDATITVTENNGSIRQYTLHGRTVLQDSRSRRNRQFYMGAVMLEWLS